MYNTKLTQRHTRSWVRVLLLASSSAVTREFKCCYSWVLLWVLELSSGITCVWKLSLSDTYYSYCECTLVRKAGTYGANDKALHENKSDLWDTASVPWSDDKHTIQIWMKQLCCTTTYSNTCLFYWVVNFPPPIKIWISSHSKICRLIW